ncbi:MAG: TOBE domain-containing protein, partial [Actinobacteria bacterium]|nr:TOBE domain-containing protein [Actinomycetota bacterium]
YVETALGRLRTRGAAAADGSGATVLLRPEQILCQGPAAGGPRGLVLSTTFYGHDATARIDLGDPGCRKIVARAAGHLLPQAGDAVSVAVEGTALVFPAGDDSQGQGVEHRLALADGRRSRSSACGRNATGY